ncbi:MAG: two-component system response regulator [Pseudomonadota bacterium]|jgi:two-component system OmpR family response regulator
MYLLVVDTDVLLHEQIRTNFADYAWSFEFVDGIALALESLHRRNFDLVMIDWHIDTEPPLEVIELIKEKGMRTSLIAISHSDEKKHIIESLRSGADDFILKPFNFEVLAARIEARLRFGSTSVIEIDDLVIDPDEEKITYKGVEIELKGKPFEVLTHLARHREVVVSKEQLLDAIWEEPELVTPNVIEVAINQIRQKMDKPLSISTIETVRRKGYRFCYPRQAQEL